MESIYNNSIEYKRHDQEFIELRTKLKIVSELSVVAKKSLGTVREYYFEVDALYNLNSSYVINPKHIKKELDKIFILVTSQNYLRDLTNMNASSKDRIRIFELNICRRIDNIFRLLCESFVEHELRPRPTKSLKSAIELETDKDKREELFALKQMGIEVKYEGKEYINISNEDEEDIDNDPNN